MDSIRPFYRHQDRNQYREEVELAESMRLRYQHQHREKQHACQTSIRTFSLRQDVATYHIGFSSYHAKTAATLFTILFSAFWLTVRRVEYSDRTARSNSFAKSY